MTSDPTTRSLWGLFDTEEKLWLGDDNGPRTFTDAFIAKVAAQVWADQLGWPLTRVIAREFQRGEFNLRDEFAVKRGTLESLRRIENGKIQ